MLSAKRLAIILYISIHAPTWGPTGVTQTYRADNGRFNPRSHMGSDVINIAQRFRFVVSIHAPTWGATVSTLSISANCRFQSTLPHGERLRISRQRHHSHQCFNPRSHMGSDMSLPSWLSIPPLFQSTLPHGERRLLRAYRPPNSRFNPRSHMGSDRLSTVATWSD